MVVLPIPLPFLALREGLIKLALVLTLPDAQASNRWMEFSLLIIQAADPSLPLIVRSVPAQGMMDLINQREAMVQIDLFISPAKELQIATDSKGIRP